MNEKKVALLSATRSGMGSDAAKKLASKGFNVSILSPSGKGGNLSKDLGGISLTGSNQSIRDINKLY